MYSLDLIIVIFEWVDEKKEMLIDCIDYHITCLRYRTNMKLICVGEQSKGVRLELHYIATWN